MTSYSKRIAESASLYSFDAKTGIGRSFLVWHGPDLYSNGSTFIDRAQPISMTEPAPYEIMSPTPCIDQFLNEARPASPCVVLDTEVVRSCYEAARSEAAYRPPRNTA